MGSKCTELRGRVSWLMEGLDEGELGVLRLIAERLTAGLRDYGPLDLRTDQRNFRRERREELADAVVYTCCEEIKRDLREEAEEAEEAEEKASLIKAAS